MQAHAPQQRGRGNDRLRPQLFARLRSSLGQAQCITISKELLLILAEVANDDDVFCLRPLIHPTVDVCLALALRIESNVHMPSGRGTSDDLRVLLEQCTVNLCCLFSLVQEADFADHLTYALLHRLGSGTQQLPTRKDHTLARAGTKIRERAMK